MRRWRWGFGVEIRELIFKESLGSGSDWGC